MDRSSRTTARVAARVAVAATLTGVVAGLTGGPAAAATTVPGAPAAHVQADLPYGPDTCAVPFVWRDARPGDHVCVTVDTRTRTAQENALAPSRVAPGTNGYGPKACAVPYVWRDAFDGDAVCVTTDRRDQAHDDNAHAQQRFARNQNPLDPKALDARLSHALSRWMDANKVVNGSMAVMRDNQLIGEFDKGQHSGAENAVPVASLSKAITAVGVMTLIDSGRLSFATRLDQLPPSFLHDTGIDRHLATAGSITIEDLLRHESGIVSDPPAANGLVGVPDTDDADLLLIKQALTAALGPRGTMAYNNINYAILGRVISSVSGEAYESYVKRMVLTPRGASGAHIGIRSMGAYGGWVISPVEYAMFARSFDPGFRMLSPQAHAFIDQGATAAGIRGTLGMFVRKAPQGRNLWHFGNWRSTATTPRQFSSYYAMWNNDVAVAVTFDKYLTVAQQDSLDLMLRNAAGMG
ncbi:MAG: serine hydrolase [Pseudonocardia sp.]|nr:serine hydrolase [Pseudonocardia sp.]